MGILHKSWRKMSERGRSAALELGSRAGAAGAGEPGGRLTRSSRRRPTDEPRRGVPRLRTPPPAAARPGAAPAEHAIPAYAPSNGRSLRPLEERPGLVQRARVHEREEGSLDVDGPQAAARRCGLFVDESGDAPAPASPVIVGEGVAAGDGNAARAETEACQGRKTAVRERPRDLQVQHGEPRGIEEHQDLARERDLTELPQLRPLDGKQPRPSCRRRWFSWVIGRVRQSPRAWGSSSGTAFLKSRTLASRLPVAERSPSTGHSTGRPLVLPGSPLRSSPPDTLLHGGHALVAGLPFFFEIPGDLRKVVVFHRFTQHGRVLGPRQLRHACSGPRRQSARG